MQDEANLPQPELDKAPEPLESPKPKVDDTEYIFKFHDKEFVYTKYSCDIFSPESGFRNFCIWLMESKLWEYFMILLILANAVVFASFDYYDRDVETTRNKALYSLNIVFVIIYGMEAILKIVAQGFVLHPNAYLMNGWNWFDLFIVLIGILEMNPYLHRVRGLRVLRTLRILKLSYTSKAMNNLMTPWIRSFRHMCDVIILLVFVLLLFSIMGLHVFNGNFYYRCRTTPVPVNGVWELDTSITRFCSAYGYGDYECPAGSYCGTPDMYDLSLDTENLSTLAEPYYDTLSYDNIYESFLLSFQVITFDSWADVMYKHQDSSSTYLARFFFPLLVFVGAFFCLNLIIAVVFETFQNYRDLMKTESASTQEAIEDKKENNQEEIREENKEEDQDDNRNETYKAMMGRGEPKLHSAEPSPQKPHSETVSMIGLSVGQESESGIRKICKAMLDNRFHKPLVILLVLGNLLILCFNRYNITESERRVLDAINTVFFALFFIELLIQIIAVGLYEYVQSVANIADLLISILGIIEVGLTFSKYSFDDDVRTVIVVFRAFRTVKLVGKWDALRETLNFLWSAKEDIMNFAILLGLFIVVFAIIGMELFADEVKFNAENQKDLALGESSRINFDTIEHALLSAFSLQIGDNWSTYYVLYMRFKPGLATLYYLSALITLNILMMNLFLGILLQNFFSDDQKQAIEEEERRNREFHEMQKKIGPPTNQYKEREETLLTALKVFKTILSHSEKCIQKRKQPKVVDLGGKSLFLFDPQDKIRETATKIVNSIWFQVLIYVMIAISSVVLTFYTPLTDPDGSSYKTAFVFDAITTGFFCVEALLKAISWGFAFNGPNSYLRSPFNVIDFLATIIAIISLSYDFNSIVVKKLFLLVRVLRAIRFIDMYEGFRARIKALVKGFPKIFTTLLISLMFMLIFAIIGTQLYKGLYYYCDLSATEPDGSIETTYDCMNLGGDWRMRDISYDNIFLSAMTLFELFTSKSWCNTLTFAADFVDINYEPKRDVSLHNMWFTVIYMIIAFLFIRAVLTGVISNTFFVHNERLQGLHKLTNAQRRWVSLSKIIFKASPIKKYKEDCKFYGLYTFLINPWVTTTISVLIVLNGIVLMLSWHREPDALYTFCEVCHYIFLAIYGIEAILKLLFYGYDYFDDGWNIFDFIIVICIFLSTILAKSIDSETLVTLMYFFRTAKLVVLFKHVKMLQSMFQVIILALPSIISFGILLFIIMYLFAIVGVFLFAGMKRQTYIEAHANFDNFWTAFLLVFRMSTFDGWNDLMHDAMRQRSQYFDCIDYPTYDDIMTNGGDPIGCGLLYSPVYFILLVLVLPFIFLNIFIAIVVATFMEITKLSASVLSDEKLGKFLEVWKKHDPDATGFIEYSRMWHVLVDLGEPLGATAKNMQGRYYSAITLWMLQLKIYCNVKDNNHYLAFYDVLEALVKRTLYRPQTLDKIYNNLSKEMLVKGLEELWDQKAQMSMDESKYVDKIEDLKYYYKYKGKKGERSDYIILKAKIPTVVWLILKVCRKLRQKVKERKEREAKEREAQEEGAKQLIIQENPQNNEGEGIDANSIELDVGNTSENEAKRAQNRPKKFWLADHDHAGPTQSYGFSSPRKDRIVRPNI